MTADGAARGEAFRRSSLRSGATKRPRGSEPTALRTKADRMMRVGGGSHARGDAIVGLMLPLQAVHL